MPPSHFVLFYVAQPEASARFYERLLRRPPVESSPTFAMFALNDSTMLGLWAKDTVQPPAPASFGGSELALTLGSAEEVEAVHARWQELGLPIAQAPTRMDFGTTCVGLDPDGHRLRAFAP
jgi:catechol 2,3-dioxygenase-like lactoylglutathione lyase family enzyme